MLSIAKKEEIIERSQLNTGGNFSPSDAEAVISNFIQKLPELPTSFPNCHSWVSRSKWTGYCLTANPQQPQIAFAPSPELNSVCCGIVRWWQLGELGQIWVHVIPRLSAGCVKIYSRLKPTWVIKAACHDAHEFGNRWLAK